MTPTCSTCRFFQPMGPALDMAGTPDTPGECRRKAPAHGPARSQWPSLWASDWCGEHQAKATTEPGTGLPHVSVRSP